MFNSFFMSTESLNRTSRIENSNIDSESINENKTHKKVNIDVLKRRVLEQNKKEKFQSRIIVGVFFVSLGIIGYLVG
tara:strand:- start:423 stop:653 length:231 start_codon:yes stop_codon:yes gene_type:complete